MRRTLLSLSLLAIIVGGCCGRRATSPPRSQPGVPPTYDARPCSSLPCTDFEEEQSPPGSGRTRLWYLGEIQRLNLARPLPSDAICHLVEYYVDGRLIQTATNNPYSPQIDNCPINGSNLPCIRLAYQQAYFGYWDFCQAHLMDGQ